MDNGLGRLAGAAAFVLMLVRLGRLLDTGPEAPDWQLIMLASAFLGGVIWWLLGQTVNNKRVSMAIFVVAGLALFFRIAVPDTLLLGFVPTPDTLGGLGDELGQTLDLIRFGVAPVFPTSGLVAILAVLMWITGALYVWGATAGPSIAMIAPSLGLYLQFAVMDRIPGGPIWMGAVAVVIALALASIGIERRQEAGRVRDVEGRPLARRAGGMALILAALVAGGSLFVADTASSLVPATGNVRWRYGGGYGPGFGGVTFDRLADLHQSIIRRSNAVVFRATLDPNAPPANEIYWRMESLDFFDGEAWRPIHQPGGLLRAGTRGRQPGARLSGDEPGDHAESPDRCPEVPGPADCRRWAVLPFGVGQCQRVPDHPRWLGDLPGRVGRGRPIRGPVDPPPAGCGSRCPRHHPQWHSQSLVRQCGRSRSDLDAAR